MEDILASPFIIVNLTCIFLLILCLGSERRRRVNAEIRVANLEKYLDAFKREVAKTSAN